MSLDEDVELEVGRILSSEDYYEMFEMKESEFRKSEDTAEELLREQYLAKTLLLNPTRNGSSNEAFELLAEAYDCLSDQERRASYNGGDRESVRKKFQKPPKLLTVLANTLHEVSEEQELNRKRTTFGMLAQGVLYLDKMVNKPVLNRTRVSDDSESVQTQSYGSDSDLSDDLEEDGDDIGHSWQQRNQAHRRRVSYSMVDDGSQLRRIARGFLKVDTVMSSMFAIRRRKEQQKRLERTARQSSSDSEGE